VVHRSSSVSGLKTVIRLLRAGLIRTGQTERERRYPERTVYELTDEGRATAAAWLEEMLSVPRYEYPEFPAALSILMMVPPPRAMNLLENRRLLLQRRVAELDASLAAYSGSLPRVSLVETEYLRAVMAAELAWVTEITGELRSGRPAWSEEDFQAHSEAHDYYRDVTE
jgi:hypothetical protein